MHYVIYSEATGLVRASGSAVDTSSMPTEEGFALLNTDGPVQWDTSRVVNGEVVTIPRQPSPRHAWEGDGWVDPAPQAQKDDEQWDRMRFRRNRLLADCDWTVMSDSPITGAARAEWLNYRMALRNLPQEQTDPYNIVWPTAPGSST